MTYVPTHRAALRLKAALEEQEDVLVMQVSQVGARDCLIVLDEDDELVCQSDYRAYDASLVARSIREHYASKRGQAPVTAALPSPGSPGDEGAPEAKQPQ